MQPTIALRDAIVATIVLSPAFINGLSLPWNFHNALAARTPALSGGIDHAFAHQVRAKADATVNTHSNEERAKSNNNNNNNNDKEDGGDDEDTEYDLPTATGKKGGSFPTGFGGGGASGFPMPTGAFGSGGFPSGCGSAALPTGTGSPFGQFGHKKALKKGKHGSKPTGVPTGCGGFGAGPTGGASPTGGFGSGFSKN